MLSANVCAGFVCYCYGELGVKRFLGFVALLGVLRVWGMLVLPGAVPSYSQGLGLRRGAFHWTRLLGGRSAGAFSSCLLGSFLDHTKRVLLCFGGREVFLK